ncbi:TPA: hypothetical protein J0A26_001972 [Escherichia coli]|nr:hypothetical protein [Escherichia coli]
MTVTHNGKQYTAKKLNDNEWQLTSVSNAQKRPEMASDATLRDYFAAKAMQAMISKTLSRAVSILMFTMMLATRIPTALIAGRYMPSQKSKPQPPTLSWLKCGRMTSTLSFGITVQNWMRILKTVVSSSTKNQYASETSSSQPACSGSRFARRPPNEQHRQTRIT